MTPKEKAEQLTDSFLKASFGVMEEYIPVPYHFAKQCALIAVEEIFNSKLLMLVEDEIFWREVKQEIEKL